MKSYRSRGLTQKCQVAKDDSNGKPLRDERNQIVLDHGGLWFYKVSGGSNHDNKRIVPEDPKLFFALKAREIQEALKAEGIEEAVTPEMVYEEYVAVFTKPAHTYAPPGQPEEFSIVLPKDLCVNWRGCVGGTNGSRPAATVAPQETSLFARLRAAKAQAAPSTPPVSKKPKSN